VEKRTTKAGELRGSRGGAKKERTKLCGTEETLKKIKHRKEKRWRKSSSDTLLGKRKIVQRKKGERRRKVSKGGQSPQKNEERLSGPNR